MKFQKPSIKKINKSFLFKITCRTALFFALMTVFLLGFYVSGTYQDFLESTLIFSLFLCSIFSAMSFFFAVSGIFQSVIWFFILKRKIFWIYSALFFVSLIFSAAIFVFCRTVAIVSNGI
jgi:hypothetical protein